MTEARPIIVRFQSERLRDDVYRARTKLKEHNQQRRDAQVVINDDLTASRSKLYKPFMTDEENSILMHVGGLPQNSLIHNILDNMADEMDLIQHSPYYPDGTNTQRKICRC